MFTSRWVSGAYLLGDARRPRRALRQLAHAVALWAALQGPAHAAPGSPGEAARALITELDRDGPAHGLVEPALNRAKEALAKAQPAAPTRAPVLEATALEWAEVARDLARASEAERASDRLEQDVSSTQTEIARLRATVEQLTARVGRARQDLKDLESSAAKSRISGNGAIAGAASVAARPSDSGSSAADAPTKAGLGTAPGSATQATPGPVPPRSPASSRPATRSPSTPGEEH